MRRRAFLIVVALALPACDYLQEGRQQSWSFHTRYTPDEVHSRALVFLAAEDYAVVRSESAFVEARKRNASSDFDVLRVFVEGVDADGTRVRVQALTEDSGGGQLRFVSDSAVGAGGRLVDRLMLRIPSPPPA